MLEAAVAREQPLPAWFNDQPELFPWEEFYVKAFFDLDTERHSGMSIGPIPWSKIQEYGDRSGLDSDMMVVFTEVIRKTDTKYREWAASQRPEPPTPETKNEDG